MDMSHDGLVEFEIVVAFDNKKVSVNYCQRQQNPEYNARKPTCKGSVDIDEKKDDKPSYADEALK